MSTNIWMYILGVVCMAIGIGVSIALHEVGHLLPAKKFGVKVTQYMVGFGPTVWSRRKGETEYGIKAIPLGGYVRMIGMYPPWSQTRAGLCARNEAPEATAEDAPLRPSSTGLLSQMSDQARDASEEEVQPGDEHRVFYRLKTWQKAVVMLGGPMMNLLIAVVLLTGYLTLYGVMDPSRPLGAVVASVAECAVERPSEEPRGKPLDCTGKPPSPAKASGLQPGDQILTIDGQKVASTKDIAALVRPNAGKQLAMEVLRQGETQQLTLTPTTSYLIKFNDESAPVMGADGKPVTEPVGYMGTTTRAMYETVRQPITEVPSYVGSAIMQTASVVWRIPEKMVGVFKAAFSDEARDPNGPASVVGVSRFAGEKAGGEVTGSILDDIPVVPFLVQLLATLNIALFVFNLIPLLPLDGGHVAGALYEGARRKIAQWRGKADPGYVDIAKALPVAAAVAVMFIAMSVLLIYADIVKPIQY